MDFETLKAECLACRRCGLCETRKNVVFGQGVPNAEVMFVGEAAPKPQREEPQATAYLVHNNQNIPITETPFMVGKYNTTIRLHYAIYDNNKVSRNHATILFDNGQYFVRDNQSRNGTTVNGKAILPLQPVALKDGDEIRLYDEVLVFHLG